MTVQPHAVVALTTAGTEYSWTIPSGASMLTIQCREGDTAIEYYFKSNANGGGPGQDGNYFSLQPGNAKTFQGHWNAGQVIYFQAVGNNGKHVEIEVATDP